MAENVVLKLDNVSKSFAKVEKDEITHALGNINLEIEAANSSAWSEPPAAANPPSFA